MKFGIIGCFYKCANDLDKVLDPWITLKSTRKFTITAVNALFKENAELGRGLDDEETRKIISSKNLDYTYFSPVPLSEIEARNRCLKYLLFEDVDYIWLLDGDEFYTVDDINNIISYVSDHGQTGNKKDCFYSINFKCYIFDGKQWVDDFCPPRIFNNRIHDGIDRFYWDNDIVYRDSTNYKQLKEVKIPKDIAHIRHMTWLNINGKEKYEYQMKHFGKCSYKWNYEEGKLEFDLEYYEKHNTPIPKIHVV